MALAARRQDRLAIGDDEAADRRADDDHDFEGLEKNVQVTAIGEIAAHDGTQNDNNTDNDHHGRGTRSVTLRECG